MKLKGLSFPPLNFPDMSFLCFLSINCFLNGMANHSTQIFIRQIGITGLLKPPSISDVHWLKLSYGYDLVCNMQQLLHKDVVAFNVTVISTLIIWLVIKYASSR